MLEQQMVVQFNIVSYSRVGKCSDFRYKYHTVALKITSQKIAYYLWLNYTLKKAINLLKRIQKCVHVGRALHGEVFANFANLGRSPHPWVALSEACFAVPTVLGRQVQPPLHNVQNIFPAPSVNGVSIICTKGNHTTE